jgi:hypothetical protein
MMIMYDMVYMDFHVRCIDMLMSLNGVEHVYTVTAGLHMMIYMVSCLDVHACLCSLKFVECFYMNIVEIYYIQTFKI